MISLPVKIYASGPNANDIKIFVGQYSIGLLQRLSVEQSIDGFLPRFNLEFPAITLRDEDPPVLTDNMVVIEFPKIVNEVEGHLEAFLNNDVTVSVGQNKIVGSIKFFKLTAEAGRDASLEIKFNNNDETILKLIPKWVKIG